MYFIFKFKNSSQNVYLYVSYKLLHKRIQKLNNTGKKKIAVIISINGV